MGNTRNIVSVIIPTYNRAESLKRTLSILSSITDRPDEVVIVDQTQNKSIANEIFTICQESTLNVKYNFLDYPSLTAARNVGISVSTGDVLLFLDDDVDVADSTISNIRKLFEDTQVALVGGIDKNPVSKNSLLGYLFYKSSWRKRNIGHMTSAIYGRFPLKCEELTPTEWAMGFCFAVRKCCVERWNLRFEENFKYYAFAEDLDFTYAFCRNAHKSGLKCYMSTLLTVNHNVSQEYRIPNTKATFMNVLHREYMSYKFFPNSFSKRMVNRWSNLGEFFSRLIKNEKPIDVLKAQIFLEKYRDDVKRGIFHYELFF